MKRFLAIGVLAAIPLLAVTPTAVADEHEPASGSALTEISAYVEPSVVYIQTQYSGSVWDRTNKQYLNDGEAFTWAGQCTGYVVNPSGYIATAGHCIDRKGTGVSVLQETAAQLAIDNAYYASSDLTIEDIIGFCSFQFVGVDSN